MESGKQQRSRGKNFYKAEKEVLLDHAIKHKQIIESKLTNSIIVQKKGEVWRSASDKINSLGVARRTVKDVKNKWSNMVQKAKKEKAEAGVYRRRTGERAFKFRRTGEQRLNFEGNMGTKTILGNIGTDKPKLTSSRQTLIQTNLNVSLKWRGWKTFYFLQCIV